MGSIQMPMLRLNGVEAGTMDFDQLETFLEVARLLSFSRAAEKRFRTQPAISAQIRALEEEIGARVLDRTGGKVSLTAAGKIFLKYVEEALEARRQIIVAMAETERVPHGELVVAANEGTWLHILPEVFAEFKKLYPDVAVSVQRAERPKIVESIIDNSIDFGVVSMPVNDKRLTTVVIHRDELVVIAPPRHPLAKCKAATLAQIAEFPLLLPKHGRSRDMIESLFDERGLKLDCSMELDSSELTKRFVAANVGIAFIAYSNVEREVRTGLLATCKPSDAHMARDLALVFRKDKALSRAALAFIEIAVKHKGPQAVSVPK